MRYVIDTNRNPRGFKVKRARGRPPKFPFEYLRSVGDSFPIAPRHVPKLMRAMERVGEDKRKYRIGMDNETMTFRCWRVAE